METEQQAGQITLPIDHLSYSALTQLLRNPLIFKLKYIHQVYDNKMGISAMVGKAGHTALEFYYHADWIQTGIGKEEARETAIDEGLAFLNEYSDSYIEYGKTGSREKMLQTYAQAMSFYFAEEPDYHKIICSEERLEAELITVDGQQLPIPAVGSPDLVEEDQAGLINVIDTKFVKSFTDYDKEDYIKIIQAQFYWHLLRAAKGITANQMIFREIKTSENSKDNAGKPQIRDYVIPFNHEAYRMIFYNLYRDVFKFLASDPVFLPNLSDPFDGEHAGLLYAQGLLTSDMSDTEVCHKVKDIAFANKKFVSSRLDRIENKHLPPEEKIKLRLAEFGIPIEPAGTEIGTSVIQYRFKVSSGVRMNSFEKHRADIEMAIEAKSSIKILAPIPGTALVGIEVPNDNRTVVRLCKDHLTPGTLLMPLGLDIHGEVVQADLRDMPHLLIAGTTGSGKSMLLHSIIKSLTEQMDHTRLQLVLIDPKRVELSAFKRKKHLRYKIQYDQEAVQWVLNDLLEEMENRYKILEKSKCRDIEAYHAKTETATTDMPYIVTVIDEFADFMMRRKTAKPTKKKRKTEEEITLPDEKTMIVRLAQMARATGIHLIISTQRPSVDVIDGLIKANFPSRIALTTASKVDSKIILGEHGAEKLSGKGDMIFMPNGGNKTRLQGFII